jgi:hypothetical protein
MAKLTFDLKLGALQALYSARKERKIGHDQAKKKKRKKRNLK